jgi:hypothetical protein
LPGTTSCLPGMRPKAGTIAGVPLAVRIEMCSVPSCRRPRRSVSRVEIDVVCRMPRGPRHHGRRMSSCGPCHLDADVLTALSAPGSPLPRAQISGPPHRGPSRPGHANQRRSDCAETALARQTAARAETVRPRQLTGAKQQDHCHHRNQQRSATCRRPSTPNPPASVIGSALSGI